MKPNANDWDEQDLLELIEIGVQEGLELDYKRCDSLQKSDAKKNEISKDVSAFANSAGGVLVYGMKENGHIPTSLDTGYDPDEISKEWLEQVINSRIQRRIDGIFVNQIQLSSTAPRRVAYVVSIPASARAPHQASDKRFYKRFNFESIPMEEYELRDVSNRHTAPDLDLEFAFRPGGKEARLKSRANEPTYAPVSFAAVISNQAPTVAECAVIHLYIDDKLIIGELPSEVKLHPETDFINLEGAQRTLKKITILWDRARGMPIFSGISVELPTLPLAIQIPRNVDMFALRYQIGAPGMTSKDKWVFLTVRDSVASFVRPRMDSDAAEEVAP